MPETPSSAAKSPPTPAPASKAKPRKAPAPAPAPALTTAQKNIKRLHKIGLRSAMDLALHLPMRYEDESVLLSLFEAQQRGGQQVQIEGVIANVDVQYKPRRQLLITLAEEHAQVVLRFVNFQAFQLKQLNQGMLVRARGELKHGFFGPEIIHPTYKIVNPGAPLPQVLTPVYPSGEGLSQFLLRKTIADALRTIDWQDTLPESIRSGLQLMEIGAAVRLLHNPPLGSDLEALQNHTHEAWQRVKFDELLAQQLSLQKAQLVRRAKGAHPLRICGRISTSLRAALPFQLTEAQEKVLREISADMQHEYPMQRLLQGDVGSGKTVVAAMAAAQAIDSGFQAALMAPTEILAEQHFRKIAAWLEPLGVCVVWMTGSLKKKEKLAAQELTQSGQAQLIIGTHALIQDAVQFAKLGLALVDEQHRFGVSQRLNLRNKGGTGRDGEVAPHQLMMSATPIPRTLAMTYYADLEVSVIDQLPPGRTPIATRAIDQERRDEVLTRISVAAREGRQVYWVCPLIEESESLQLQAATDTHAMLELALPGLQIGLVHGRLKAQEKQSVMDAFIAGDIHVLVATTVIEVGVDVPNASLMVIEHAERFGLSQLHQLRGRVGRGAQASACLLLYQSPLGQVAKKRLMTMRETTDGFEIARRDLEIRGPGEFLGARQSGEAMLRFADLEQDQWLIDKARHVAQHLLHNDSAAVDAHLARWLGAKEDFLKV